MVGKNKIPHIRGFVRELTVFLSKTRDKLSSQTLIGAIFLAPPVFFWLAVILFAATRIDFFKQLILAVYIHGTIFSEPFIGFIYPLIAIACGVCAYMSEKRHDRSRNVYAVRIIHLGTLLFIIGAVSARYSP
jgi:hypothetical protein